MINEKWKVINGCAASRPIKVANRLQNYKLFTNHYLLFCITLLEFLHASGAVDQFLFAREERVAIGANFNADVLFGWARVDHVAAVAGDRRLAVFGVNLLFHLISYLVNSA